MGTMMVDVVLIDILPRKDHPKAGKGESGSKGGREHIGKNKDG